MKNWTPTGNGLTKYYVGASVGCISSKCAPLFLCPFEVVSFG